MLRSDRWFCAASACSRACTVPLRCAERRAATKLRVARRQAFEPSPWIAWPHRRPIPALECEAAYAVEEGV
eukprot:2190464-Pleurochrysis_carterae.AAC.3